ncbi:transmembrane protein 107 like isoform X1 [Rhincodon typus]|uniref:transmembrane protein 107 like isoform X1 n=1 Tax=Rhincodon typus TaxID=259920 RepID=UPI00202F10B0|nr:transmembrane protein 107 like isoform X1 [Rhincodon typus]XP_048471396.1 transmembrane protein 107 like isoform X1 [Rhincodon typus]XP_048471397.1 transmembrane protein 107 like isoform X1 [Rhincodon typus]XP_048471399.1 transmembrane protein 107 like isoform X1 [Rhincodon typus]XP_048471401.1 transmembrane protein 107 like isoform X1 [Rhincodon typus]XP_048471402.1 transmembrane protein 107 like isoform X1 [Rhincodon typus]XP_048471403.1 transmembrane protein 107 like isoform X1 [Rhincod
MPIPSSLIPSRFLTLVAHLVIVIDIFWSRENNVLASLPPTYTPHQYQSRDTELIVALSVTLGMFLIELLGFFSGVSMFNSTQSLISIAAHCSACICLSFFVFAKWECWTYWYIFSFCSALPASIEIVLMIAVFGLKKKPL